jgi:hypothetical protein
MVLGSLLLAATLAQQDDAARVLRAARAAQAEFETVRRSNLPVAYTAPAQRCDHIIGRFCYWDDGQPSPRQPPGLPEPDRIRRARARLVTTLDSTAALSPADDWTAGQLVRYLAETDTTRAIAAARHCQATAWWCAALTGFALHVAGEFRAADSAFDVALHGMPTAERCRWTDLSALLDGALAKRYRARDCEERSALADSLWWVAQPLHSLRTNDRRTEHFARATLARIAQDARTTYSLHWGDDLRELTLRYGWPVSWTRDPSRITDMLQPVVTGHDREPAFHFFPEGTLDDRRARERYAPAYAAAFVLLEHQAGAFRRGDSCIVVAVYDVSDDSAFARHPPSAALVLAREPQTAPIIARQPDSPAGTLVATTSCEPQLFSLELFSRAASRAARTRYTMFPAGMADGIALSDLLLFDPADSLPGDLAAVLPHTRAAATARAGTSVGLFWEVYGLPPDGAPLTIAVAVAPQRAGWLRRATSTLGLSRRPSAVRLAWQELARPRDAVAPRAVALDLTGLSPGRYQIEVVVKTGAAEASAAREITIERP